MQFNREQIEKDARNCINRVSTESARSRLTAELDSLLAQYDKAPAADKPGLEARLIQFGRDAEVAASVNLWSWFSIILVSGTVVAYFAGIVLYMRGLGSDRYSSIEATRPILVFTLIVAMLGFGGLLIVRALFSGETDEAFQRRFRHAREIFLVFAGIFGTIIGFYFGAADSDTNKSAPTLELRYAERFVTASISSGTGPFTGIYTPASGNARLARTSERVLTFPVEGTECPKDAKVLVFDSFGRSVESVVPCAEPATNSAGSNVVQTNTAPDANGSANALGEGNNAGSAR